MPNITGSINTTGQTSQWSDISTTIAFEGAIEPIYRKQNNIPNASDTDNNVAGFSFDASRSNTTYGNSTTVTPLSESCLFYIRY